MPYTVLVYPVCFKHAKMQQIIVKVVHFNDDWKNSIYNLFSIFVRHTYNILTKKKI